MRRLAVWLLTAFVPLAASAAGTAADDPCAIEGVERIVAIADIHGGHSQFVSILKAAGLIDGRERWTGAKTHFVQTGDVLDRGNDSRKSMDLLRKLEEAAAKAGGRVHALLGNHEVMRMLGDFRYVSPGELKEFADGQSRDRWQRAFELTSKEAEQRAKAANEKFDEAAYRAQFEREIPLGFIEMRNAFGPEGEYGKWLRTHNATVKINGVHFLHGGISPAVAPLGCAAINSTVQADITTNFERTRQTPAQSLAAREDGPLWYRGLAQQTETILVTELDTMLKQLDARAIVVGHTVAPNGTVIKRFNGRVFQIDTGMLDSTFFPGGKPSALEIKGDEVTAIYTDRKEPLGTLSAVPTAAAAQR
jgi:Calcineurin-like phosphoesterase